MVSHIVNYKGFPASGITAQITADTNDLTDPAAGDFPTQADSIAAASPDIAWQRNYLGVTAQVPGDATMAMTTAANGGADMLIYVGHGNAIGLGNASPRILDTTSIQNWTGNVPLLQATCTAHWMAKDVQPYYSIAIQGLMQPQGGLSVSIGTSTYMNSDVAVAFMTNLLKNANVSGMRWGIALLQSQQQALSQGATGYNADLGRTEQLFGDPAMQVFGSGGGGETGGTSGGGNSVTRPPTTKTTTPTPTPSAPSTSSPAAPGTF